ncbi:hypothetical protein FACS1894189_7930 [Planctomycetales bacterium]|nr:hypothetical protein FACS1894189_7930 [Planctomycetales bacterium]
MRFRFPFLLLFILLVSAVSVSADDSLFEELEDVPFPFEQAAEGETRNTKETEKDIAALKQLLKENAVSQAAVPEPPVLLRPRYHSAETSQVTRIAVRTQPGVIQQTAAIEETLQTPSPLTGDIVPGSSVGGLSVGDEPRAVIYDHGNNSVIDSHTDDDWTCGKSHWSFQHLDEVKPNHGVCRCCGLLTCVNKTAGQFYFDGWVDAGSFMNTHWQENKENFPIFYNDQNGKVGMNQLYLTLGRRVNTKRDQFDLGGRVDILYGSDYYYTSSLGLETRRTNELGNPTMTPIDADPHWNQTHGVRRNGDAAFYGLSLPQAYGELFIPFGYGVTVKAGHFYSGMGYESVMSPNNFFYSHSYSFMHGLPLTLTGGTADVQLGQYTTAVIGLTQGENVFDSPTDQWSILAGLVVKSKNKKSSLSFLVHTGEQSLREGDNRTSYSLTWKQQLSSRWQYGLEHTFGTEKNGAILDGWGETRGTARWLSLAQYLQWSWSERFALGLRAEWFQDKGHSRVQRSPVSLGNLEYTGQNYYEITLGANWKPTRYLTIRPEVRYDWSNVKRNGNGIYSDFNKNDMVSFAIDGIFRF